MLTFFLHRFLRWNPYQTWFSKQNRTESCLIGISSLKWCKKKVSISGETLSVFVFSSACLCFSLCICVFLCLYFSVYLCISVCLSVSIYLFLSICFCLSLSYFDFESTSLSHSLSLSLCRLICIFTESNLVIRNYFQLHLCVCVCVCVCMCVCVSQQGQSLANIKHINLCCVPRWASFCLLLSVTYCSLL